MAKLDDNTSEMADRRKKTPEETAATKRGARIDLVSAGSGVGSFGLGFLILSLVNSQGKTLEDHSDWIHGNKLSGDRVVEMLNDIRKDFGRDIQGFELKHAGLRESISEVRLKQASMGTRLMSVELATDNPAWGNEKMQDWVDLNFVRKDK